MEKRSMWLVPNSSLSPEIFIDLIRCTASFLKANGEDMDDYKIALEGVLIDPSKMLAVGSNNRHMRLAAIGPQNRVSNSSFIIGTSFQLEEALRKYSTRPFRFSESERNTMIVTIMGADEEIEVPIIKGEYPRYYNIVEDADEASIVVSTDTNALATIFKGSDLQKESLLLPKGFAPASKPIRYPDAIIAPNINVEGHQVKLLSLITTIGDFEGEVIVGYNDTRSTYKGFVHLWLDDSGMDINDELF